MDVNKRQTLFDLAGSIADGAPIDWASIDARAGGGVERRLLRQFQLIARIAALHRMHAEDEIKITSETTAP